MKVKNYRSLLLVLGVSWGGLALAIETPRPLDVQCISVGEYHYGYSWNFQGTAEQGGILTVNDEGGKMVFQASTTQSGLTKDLGYFNNCSAADPKAAFKIMLDGNGQLAPIIDPSDLNGIAKLGCTAGSDDLEGLVCSKLYQ